MLHSPYFKQYNWELLCEVLEHELPYQEKHFSFGHIDQLILAGDKNVFEDIVDLVEGA